MDDSELFSFVQGGFSSPGDNPSCLKAWTLPPLLLTFLSLLTPRPLAVGRRDLFTPLSFYTSRLLPIFPQVTPRLVEP